MRRVEDIHEGMARLPVIRMEARSWWRQEGLPVKLDDPDHGGMAVGSEDGEE